MPDASNDPALLVLKVRAYLQKGKIEEAFQVHSINSDCVLLVKLVYSVITI